MLVRAPGDVGDCGPSRQWLLGRLQPQGLGPGLPGLLASSGSAAAGLIPSVRDQHFHCGLSGRDGQRAEDQFPALPLQPAFRPTQPAARCGRG